MSAEFNYIHWLQFFILIVWIVSVTNHIANKRNYVSRNFKTIPISKVTSLLQYKLNISIANNRLKSIENKKSKSSIICTHNQSKFMISGIMPHDYCCSNMMTVNILSCAHDLTIIACLRWTSVYKIIHCEKPPFEICALVLL